MNFGPAPWQQANWDWRAAGNFMCGGAGAGLIVFSAFSGANGIALAFLVIAGLALVGLGLFCVWLEIGRPLRAFHVFFNPRTSWMSREAFTATLLFPAGLAAAAGVPGCKLLAAVLALAFIYCQGRMLQAAKGIPAWREPMLTPLILTTGLAEGAGIFFLVLPILATSVVFATEWASALLVIFGALVLARGFVWFVYRRRLAAVAAPDADAALGIAQRVMLMAGTLLPLLLVAAILSGMFPLAQCALIALVAGLAAAAAGAYAKFIIITRAAFNQGFALAHLPLRGARP